MIFADQSTAGQWHYCPDCKSKGSLVHLLSRVWKLDTLATLTKLNKEIQTIPKEVLTEKGAKEYDELSITQYEKLAEFWSNAKRNQWFNSPELLNISKYDIIATTSTQEWSKKTLEAVVGAHDARDIYEFFTGDKVKRDTNTMKKIFGESDWRGVLVMPFYDMPGRINALLCLGRDGDPEKDIRFVQLVPHKDAGLQFHPRLLHDRPSFLIAMEDPTCYVLASIRHYNVSRSPANFVLWHSGKDAQTQPTAWDMVGSGKDIIFWNPTISKETIKQAMKVNGLISTYTISGSDQKTIYNKLAAKPAIDLIRSIKKAAKPWPRALDVIIGSLTDAELEDFYFQLGLSDREFDQALRYCSYETCVRLDTITRTKPICRTLVYDGKQIEARPDGWFHLHGDNEELIVDANLRIDSVVHYPATNKSIYIGVIEYSGNEYPFTEDIKVVEAAPLAWMRDTLIKNKAGLLRYNPKWSRKIASIAIMLQKPKCQIGIEKVGWDSDQRAMVLPKFSVSLDGDIQVNLDQITDETLPACGLPLPQDFTPEELEPLVEDTDENRIFWALWCLFTSNIVAPIFSRSPTAIAVHGFSSRNAASLISDVMELADVTPQDIHKDKFHPVHSWLYKYGFGSDARGSNVAQFIRSLDEDFNVVVRTNWYQTLSLLLSGGWHAMMVDDIVNLPVQPTDIQRALLPSYIRYVLNRPARDFIHKNNFAQSVTDDVYSWLSSMNVDASIVRLGKSEILYADDTLYADKFGELLTQFIDDGDLTITQKSKSDDINKRLRTRTEMIEMPDYGGILVSDAAVASCLAKHNAPPISTFVLTKRLLAANAIVGEIELGTATGWIIRFDWWDSVSHRYRIKRINAFNIVG